MLTIRPWRAAQLIEEGVGDVKDTFDVDIDDVFPVLNHGIAVAGEGRTPVDAGVVDQDRYLAHFGGDLCGGGDTGGTVRDVESEARCLAAGVGHGLGCRSSGLGVDVEGDDLGALSSVTDGDGLSDAGAGAGNRRAMSVQ